MDTQFWIAQIFSGVAVLLGFISYQVKTQRQLLAAQTATAVMTCLSYLLLGAATGLAMNVVAIIRNLVYFARDKKGSKSLVFPIVFACVQGAMGILTWEAWYSVFSVAGLVINTLCLSFKNPQNVRKSILVTSPMVIVYNAFVVSIGGVVYEVVAIASAALGIWRNRKGAAAAG